MTADSSSMVARLYRFVKPLQKGGLVGWSGSCQSSGLHKVLLYYNIAHALPVSRHRHWWPCLHDWAVLFPPK